MANGPPHVVDLNAELAKLTMFCRTPDLAAMDRKGSVAQLASYCDGLRGIRYTAANHRFEATRASDCSISSPRAGPAFTETRPIAPQRPALQILPSFAAQLPPSFRRFKPVTDSPY
jgi:hypothetical protein